MPSKYAELRKKALQKTRKKLKESMYKRDHLIVKVVRTIDELDRTINLLTERLRDWYSVYFPELERELPELRDYVRAVAGTGYREKYSGRLAEAAEKTVGADLPDRDVERMIGFAKRIEGLLEERDSLVEYLEELVSQEAPNMNALVGPTIAARLISIAGSLERLAEMPSSTIQVLGAEKALFAHLRKKGVPSPKHGVIFSHPAISGAKKRLRGKIARRLAGKIAIAAKVDYFKGEFVGDKLREEFEKEVEELKSQK